MIKASQIPDEVVEAAARAACREVERAHGSLETWRYFGFDSVDAFIDAAWPNYADQSRAAILTALAAWPGAKMRTTFWPNEDGVWVVPRHMWSLPIGEQEPSK